MGVRMLSVMGYAEWTLAFGRDQDRPQKCSTMMVLCYVMPSMLLHAKHVD